jgi:hypothetical protein
VPVSGDVVQFAPAFPGWTGFVRGVQQDLAYHDFATMDSAILSILDQQWANRDFETHGTLIAGRFTALLISGLGVDPLQPADTTLAQTGTVPGTAQSLLFKAYMDYVGNSGSFTVTLGGHTLSLVPLASGTNYTMFGADIHAWAGQRAELSFTVLAQRPHFGNTYLYLDSIQFSDQPVPEPGVPGLCALGGLLVGWHVLRRPPKQGGPSYSKVRTPH